MLRYITRHGQVIPSDSHHMYSPGDVPLSDLGREQAKLLGERLKKENFHGPILSSPLLRTLETSEIIAEITNTKIYPCAFMHEIFSSEQAIDNYKYITLQRLKTLFSHIADDAVLDVPWLPKKAECFNDVMERVRNGVTKVELELADKAILYVGHGASSSALLGIYEIPSQKHTTLFNCSLSYTDTDDYTSKPVYCCTLHLPYDKTTSNHLSREKFDNERLSLTYDKDISIPEDFEMSCGPKILHIGDTNSVNYSFYDKLISKVKPDVIIHTGDFVDEVKVGCYKGLEKEYTKKLGVILGTLNKSNARLILTAGNNDIVSQIKALSPKAEIYEENSIVDIFGRECRVGHHVTNMSFDKKLTFYGHSVAHDKWKYSFNSQGMPCRFNSMWGSFVYFVNSDKFFRFKP